MDKVWDVIVVGAGPAGCTAALYAARAGLSVLVLSGTAPGGQVAEAAEIDNYPGFHAGVRGPDLAVDMVKGAERFGAVFLGQTAAALRPGESGHTVVTEREEHLGRTVIAATGASPRLLGLPDEGRLRGRGVSYCATCDGMFFKGKDVAVVGGGNTAAGEALLLARLCRRVTLIHRRQTLRCGAVERAALEAADNVTLLLEHTVTALRGEGQLTGVEVTEVNTGRTEELACSGLFAAIGRIPATAPFRSVLPLDGDGWLAADEDCRTPIPGIFAAGDVRAKPLRQIVTAVADGARAAQGAEEYLSR